MHMTPGMKSSEFFLSIIVLITNTVLAFAGHITDAQWAQVSAAVAGLYAIGRGLAKRQVPAA